jgi:excisionase family DNA binding protein
MVTIFNQDRLLTAEEVGQALGIKPSTVSKWVFEKKIPYVKFGPGKKSIVMFNPKRLNEWVKENSHEPGSRFYPE